MRSWVFQDWSVNRTRPDSQLLLAWFRLAQWAQCHWGPVARIVVTRYWWIASMVIGIEIPPTIEIGPRVRLYHPHGIVINPHAHIGADCQIRHGVTVGNKVDRAGRELGVATLGDDVDLGAGCVVVGDLYVGDHARIGALAVVTKTVPPWAVAAGNPAVVIRIEEPPAGATSTSPTSPPPISPAGDPELGALSTGGRGPDDTVVPAGS